MPTRRPYRKKPGLPVVAIQLKLDTEGLVFRKWGAEQRCRAGDWLVDNDGDVYAIAADSFAKTYTPCGRGLFEKTETVWAERADTPGSVATREGRTHYEAGDYLVSNDEDGSDAYAVAREKFEAMYEAAG